MTPTQFNFEDYLNALRRRLPLFLKVALPVVLIGVGLATWLPDVYRSSTEFRIDLEGPGIDVVEPLMLTNYADQYIGSLRQKVTSRDNLHQWLDELDVYPEFKGQESPAELVSRLRDNIRVETVTTSVVTPGTNKPVALITGFRVGFDSHDPATAQRVAERLATEFVKEDRATRTERAATASTFLQEQIDLRRAEIVELESRMADFKEAHAGTLPEMMQLNMTVMDRMERDLEGIQTEIRGLQQDRIFRSAQLDELVQKSASASQLAQLEQEYLRMTARYGSGHPDLINIKRQIAALTTGPATTGESAEIAQLEGELAAARQRYSEEHPDVLRLTRQLETLRAETRGTMASMRMGPGDDPLYLQLRAQVNAIDTRIESLRSRAQDIRGRLAETEERVARTPQVEREYLALIRDLDSARSTLRNLQERLATAQQTEALEAGERGARITQIQRAYVPESPASPPRLAIVVLSLFLAVSLGGMVAILAEGMDSTVRGSKDIYAVLQTQPIGTIPIVHNSVSRAQARRRVAYYGGGALILAAAVVLFARLPF
jgi:polysaccharide biosynthesis transport protein